MPANRSQAQIEASRRNGARSRGPVTPEGKARSSRNALTHGLTATQHLVLEDEAPDDLDELIETITAETGAVSEIEARLARRLAIAFWKGERAEKMEVALLDAAPRTRMDGYRQEEADPLTTFDVRRFNAIRGHQAAQGREISLCLKELRLLRKEAMARTDEPETVLENEPERPAVANDDGPPHLPSGATELQGIRPRQMVRTSTEPAIEAPDRGRALVDRGAAEVRIVTAACLTMATLAAAGAAEVDVQALFARAELDGRVGTARKTRPVDARPAVAGEVVVTVIAGEGRETQSPPARPGDMVVRNRCAETGNEEILVSAAKFPQRYQGPTGPADADGWAPYRPTGVEMRYLTLRPDEGPFSFMAPWGEPMLAKPGDAIVQNPADPSDTYRIAAAAFACTYEILEPAAG